MGTRKHLKHAHSWPLWLLMASYYCLSSHFYPVLSTAFSLARSTVCSSVSLLFFINLSFSSSFSMSVCLLVCLSLCLSVCLSVCPSLTLCLCLLCSLSLSLSVTVCLSVSLKKGMLEDKYWFAMAAGMIMSRMPAV